VVRIFPERVAGDKIGFSGGFMNSNHIKAVVFDMGGVFVQTVNKEPRKKLARRLGLSDEALSQIVFQSESAQLATAGVIGEKIHWEFIATQFGLKEAEIEKFWEEFWGGDELDKDLVKFTQSLKNDYKIGLLSNAWSGVRDLLTRKFNFLDLFDVSVFSAEVNLVKPNPEFYSWMMEQLDVDYPESIFVDDFIENIQAADALGMQTVHFKNTKQAIEEIKTILGT